MCENCGQSELVEMRRFDNHSPLPLCAECSGLLSQGDAGMFNARRGNRATLTSPRYVVQNRGAAWAVHDNERHMDISLYTDEQFTQEFCQRMNTTPTESET